MDTNIEELIDELVEHKQELRDLVDNLRELLRGVDSGIYERARRTWLADIEMAIDNNHSWLGRAGSTMQDTIEELRRHGTPEDEEPW